MKKKGHAALPLKLQLAIQHHQKGRLAEAEQLFLEVIKQNPKNINVLRLFAHLKYDAKKYEEAIGLLCAAMARTPKSARVHCQLGKTHMGLRQYLPALLESQLAAMLDPSLAEAFCNMGICLRELKRHDDAIEALLHSIKLKPKAPVPYMHLGNVLRDLDQWHNALEAYSRGIELNPLTPEPYSNRANTYKDLGRFEEAMLDYEKAIELKPDFQDAHLNYSIVLLMLGKFERGWEEYEWRLHSRKLEDPAFKKRLWDGSPIPNRALWLHTEQGFGDAINFIRFAKVIRPYCGSLLVSVSPKLKRAFKRVAGPDVLLSTDDPPPFTPFHAPFMSIPGLFKCGLHNTPAEVPYIHAEQELIRKWKERLDAACGNRFKIGLCWQGNKDFPDDRNRSIPLKRFERFFEREDVQFVSLQKGYGEQQIKENGFEGKIIDWTREMDTGPDAFVDMSAVMKNLDLVLSVDTSVAHLAGALAMPVWMLVPFIPDWRWLSVGESSHWYPTMRIFRQPHKKDWDSVFAQLERALHERLLAPVRRTEDLDRASKSRGYHAAFDKGVDDLDDSSRC